MADDPRIEELLSIWDRAAVKPNVQELCRAHPELLPALQQQIAALQAVDVMLKAPTQACGQESVDQLPGQIGGYGILKVLGSGGMGTVYLARQQKPMRMVAIKVIRPGLATSTMLRRFEVEAEVLGRLQHPGIAQVFEAGSAQCPAGSLPFFVMELVCQDDGSPAPSLNDYIKRQKLSVKEKLRLLARVADAVHYAHQRGVIHRDLKPANILVDATGQPKILDFGVARMTDADVLLTTQQTEVGQLVGTLPYMSPEQAGGDPREVDIRSDVYALGVIGFELLTGERPHCLENKLLLQIVRTIQEQEPQRLSRLDRTLRGDVETIIAKALEKDKDQRYQSAAELAADIRRYLAHEPITARSASGWYLATRFVRRNGPLVGAVCGVILALSTGLVLARIEAVKATTKEGQALAARDAEAKQRGIADEAKNQAEFQAAEATRSLASGMIAQAEALRFTFDADAARECLLQSRGLSQSLGESTTAADLALWQLFSAQPRPLLTIGDKDGPAIEAFASLPDGRVAVTANSQGKITMWDLVLGQPVAQFPVDWHPANPRIAVTSDGTSMLIANSSPVLGGRLEQWRIPDGIRMRNFALQTKSQLYPTVSDIAVTPDGSLAVTVGKEEPGPRLFDLRTGAHEGYMSAETPGLHNLNVAISSDGNRIFTIGRDSETMKLFIWDAIRRTLIKSTPIPFGASGVVSVLPDKSAVYVMGANSIASFNVLTGAKMLETAMPASEVTSMSLSRDNQRLLCAGGTQSVCVWDVNTGRRRTILSGHKGAFEAQWLGDGPGAVTASLVENSIATWNTQSSELMTTTSPLLANQAASISISHDGAMAACAADNAVVILDLATGKPLLRVLMSTTIASLAFSTDDSAIVCSTANGNGAYRCELSTGARELLKGADRTGSMYCFSADASVLVSAEKPTGKTQPILVWHRDGPSPMIRLYPSVADIAPGADTSHPAQLVALAVSSDGGLALTSASNLWEGGERNQVELWDTRTGKRLRALRTSGEKERARCLAFSSDGKRALLGNVGRTVTLWDLDSGIVTAELKGHSGTVQAVAFSADGKLAASAGSDGSIKIWDLLTAREAASIPYKTSHESSTSPGLSFAPSGHCLVYGNADGSVTICNLDAVRRCLEFDRLVAKAKVDLAARPDNPAARALLGDWYAFRGMDAWAVGLLESSRSSGAAVSALAMARCYWKLGRLNEAQIEFKRARSDGLAQGDYLRLCEQALTRPGEQKPPPIPETSP